MVSDAAGRLVEYEYTDGLLTRVVGADDNVIQFAYDDKDRIEKVLDGDGSVKRVIEYDASGYVASMKDGGGEGYTFL